MINYSKKLKFNVPDIKEWVKEQLKGGYSREAIKQALVKGGYNPNLVDEVITENLKGIKEKTMEENIRKKKLYHKILIVALLVAAVAIFAFYSGLLNQVNFALPFPSQTSKPEDVAFISEVDLDFQSKVKDITGYDWGNFLNADGSENSKVTALLFLANEIDALDDNFNFVDRSVGINKNELPLNLTATDASKENLLKLIRNVKSVDNVFFSKGLETAKIRANRLSVIEDFFKRYSLPEGEISLDVNDVFAEMLGLSVDDYSRVVSLMIVNYKLFFS